MPGTLATKRFYELIWPLRTDVLRVSRFLTRDADLAEDLSQETLMKAFRAIDRPDFVASNLKCWLLTILRNSWRDRVRSTRDVQSLEVLPEEPADVPRGHDGVDFRADPQAVIEGFSDRQIIESLQSLPDEIRWTVLLVHVEGIGTSEAAEILGVPGGTIKSRAHRGRAMLRRMLSPSAVDHRRLPPNGAIPDVVGLTTEKQ